MCVQSECGTPLFHSYMASASGKDHLGPRVLQLWKRTGAAPVKGLARVKVDHLRGGGGGEVERENTRRHVWRVVTSQTYS